MTSTQLAYNILSLESIVFTKKILDENDKTIDIRTKKAKQLIRNHALISNGIGLIPLPFLDLVTISGNQMIMLTRLAKLYKVPVKKDLMKSLISIVIYELSAIGTYTIFSSLFKSVPFVGTLMGGFAASVHATIATFIMGSLFVQHFEAGGTFLDFEPQKVKDFFKELNIKRSELE